MARFTAYLIKDDKKCDEANRATIARLRPARFPASVASDPVQFGVSPVDANRELIKSV